MRLQIAIYSLLILALAACKPSNEIVTTKATTELKPAALPPAPIKKSDWENAIKATYEKSQINTDKEGVTEFVACFQTKDGNKCTGSVFGKHDAFRHLTIFTPANSESAALGIWKYLHSYVSLIDCKRPSVLLSPHIFSKEGWLFMDKVSVLADGELLLEHKFTSTEVDRDNNTWGIDERAHWVASDNDLSALKRIASAKVIIVRLSGAKGYVTVAEKDISRIKEDFKSVLAIYSVLDAAAASKEPAECI